MVCLEYLFVGGSTLACFDACDANDDDSVNVADAVYILEYLFLLGPPPCPPFPGCGTDPTPDTMPDCIGPFSDCGVVSGPPSITSLPVIDATEGSAYSYDVEASDPDVGDVLTYSLPVGPVGAAIDAGSGVVSWTPTLDQAGDHAFVVQVEDLGGLFDKQVFTVAVANTNQPPTITSPPVTSAVEGSVYLYNVDATDPDVAFGDGVTYSLPTAPAGATIDRITGVVTWTPTLDQAGDHAIVVRAEDTFGLFDEQPFSITVANTNQSPVITSTAVVVGMEAESYSYDVDADDPDLSQGDTLSFSLLIAPAGASIDDASGLLTWTPGLDDAGSHAFVVMVEDFAGLFDKQSFVVAVANANQGPSITSTAITSATEGQLYFYDVDGTDPDLAFGDSVTYSLPTAPSGAMIDRLSGAITWTPTLDQSGTHDVTVRIDDSAGLFDVQSFTIVVANTSQPPVITSTPTLDATEAAPYVYDVDADDPDLSEGDAVSFALLVAPIGATIDPASGEMNWTPSFDQPGQHAVVVRAMDTGGLFDDQSFTITVANTNQPPTLTSTPVLAGMETQPYSYDADASDTDLPFGDSLTFSLPVAPTGATVDPETGAVSWTPSLDQSGDHPVVVRVADAAGLIDEQNFTISVANLNQPPAITSTAVLTGVEGELYAYGVEAADPDLTVGDLLTFSIQSGPTGATIDSISGAVTWTPGFDQAGDHATVVRVDDAAGLFDEQSFTIVVDNVNQPPAITSTAPTTATEGQPYAYPVEAEDLDSVDGDTLEFSLPIGPEGAAIDPASGLLSWTPTLEQAGDHPVTVRVEDVAGLFDEQEFTITVANTNQPPTITSTPLTVGFANTLYSYDVDASDPDTALSDTLTYSLTESPVGASIEPGSGVLSWTPTLAQLGDHPVTVRVEDSASLFDTQSFTISVSDATDSPVTVDDDYIAGPGCTIDIDAATGVLANDSDPNGDTLTAILLTPPTNGSVTLADDGSFSYTHDGSATTTDTFVYEASDGFATMPGNVTLHITEYSFGFLDHFDATTIDPRWVSSQTASGTAVLSGDSYVAFDSPTVDATGFLSTATDLDPSQSQTWSFCVRRIGGGNVPDLIGLWRLPDGQPPQSETESVLDTQRLASIALVDDGVDPTIRFRYDPSGDGNGRHWDGEPFAAWTDPGVLGESVNPIRQGDPGDWYVVGFEIDGPGQAVRFFAAHKRESLITDGSQGVRMVALTDWVDYASFGGFATDDRLWLTIGDRHNDAYAGQYDVEWVRHEAGEAFDGITNARPTASSEYVLRHHRSHGTQFMPDGRGLNVLVGGGPGTWNDRGNRKKSIILDDDGTYYLFYEGLDSNFESSIGMATATSIDGPWSPSPTNPVIARTVLPGAGVNYDILTAPRIIKDNAEPDVQKRWKMLACGEVRLTATHRMFLMTAPAPDGPWVLEPGPGLDGSVLDESLAGDWKDDGVCDPVVWWHADTSEWRMYYSGLREKDTTFGPGGWSVGFASSPDLINWVEDPGNPIIQADDTQLRSWTGINGRTITLTDASGFEEESLLVIRNQSTQDGWGLSRIRRITGNDVELYHEIGGITGTDANRTVAMANAGSISPMALVREPNGCYRLYVTTFQPFVLGILTAGFGNCELTGALTAPTELGPWTWDHLGAPHVLPNIWGANRNQENLRTVLAPTNR